MRVFDATYITKNIEFDPSTAVVADSWKHCATGMGDAKIPWKSTENVSF